MALIDLAKLDSTPLKLNPYPYCVVDDLILPDEAKALLTDFPTIRKGGSFPLPSVAVGERLSALVDELKGEAFRHAIEKKFSMDLTGRSSMITLRGFSRPKDGRIHTDSKSKLITVLIYFNKPWTAETGKLRILRNGTNMNDYVEEVTPANGTALIFKVTPNCWHGYLPFEGTRQSLQFNYVVDDAAAMHNLSRHRLSAWVKKLMKRSN